MQTLSDGSVVREKHMGFVYTFGCLKNLLVYYLTPTESNLGAHENKIRSTLVLRLMAENEFAMIPVAEYFISPEAFMEVHNPSQSAVALEYAW